ncbi:uncharacterized protein LOC134767407 [Penaeus indicus]|uniref:uncharacterized protein LOC134767407 n=1 Tax=Penaeus indicus TaxID=29960 RepID=UPI00300D4891
MLTGMLSEQLYEHVNANDMLPSEQKNCQYDEMESTDEDEVLGDVNIKRGISQGDSLSPLLFVVCLIPMSLILRKMKPGYSLGKNQPKLNHLLYMDDLKLFGLSERDIESLVNTVHRFSCDIGMQFGIEKWGVIELPDGEKMKGVNEKAKNIWAVAVMRYGAGIVKWTKEELKKLDRQTREILTMNGALYPKSDVDRLYVARQRGGRGLQSVLETIQSEENSLRWLIRFQNLVAS